MYVVIPNKSADILFILYYKHMYLSRKKAGPVVFLQTLMVKFKC